MAKADDATTLAALIEQDPLGRVARFEDGGRFRLAAGGA